MHGLCHFVAAMDFMGELSLFEYDVINKEFFEELFGAEAA